MTHATHAGDLWAVAPGRFLVSAVWLYVARVDEHEVDVCGVQDAQHLLPLLTMDRRRWDECVRRGWYVLALRAVAPAALAERTLCDMLHDVLRLERELESEWHRACALRDNERAGTEPFVRADSDAFQLAAFREVLRRFSEWLDSKCGGGR